MAGGGERDAEQRTMTFCLVPRELASKLHEPLRRHFAGDPCTEVVVEQRAAERRSRGDRRMQPLADVSADRRRIRGLGGRRVGDRRAALVVVEAPEGLPRKARPHSEQLVFVERLEQTALVAEDLDTARIVTRIQAGDGDLFPVIYMRYFDRVYGYLRIATGNPHDAEDVVQQVFLKVFEALPRYERRAQPFRAWVFRIVRNCALDHVQGQRRIDVVEPSKLSRRQERDADPNDVAEPLTWLADRELLMLIERLPVAQRQVLVLRYMLGLTSAEAGEVLGRTANDVRNLQARALTFLRARLTALGRAPQGDRGIRMRRWIKPAPVLRARRFALGP